MSFKCFLRHQGGKSKDQSIFHITGNADSSLKIRTAGRQITVIALIAPAFSDRNLSASKSRSLPRFQGHGKLCIGRRFCHEIKMISFTLLNGYPEISDIVYFSSGFIIHPEGRFPVVIESVLRKEPEGSFPGIPARNPCRLHLGRPLVHTLAMIEGSGPAVLRHKNPLVGIRGAALRKQGILKGPIPNHFRIEPSVCGMVNVLKKEAVKLRRRGKFNFFRIDSYGVLCHASSHSSFSCFTSAAYNQF